MAWGDAVNTSARLQTAAPIDGILVDEATYRATARTIEYREVESVRAKGKANLVPAWEALATRARPGLDLPHGARGPFIGRDLEIAALRDALWQARAERKAQLVTLVGVPGIGKSRLLLELFAEIESGRELIAWRHGRTTPYEGGKPFSALGEIVKAQAGILETDGIRDAEEKLRLAITALVDAPGETARIAEHLRPLVGLGAESDVRSDSRETAFAAWRHFLEALAEQRPLVLVFEDLHWADDGLLDFVEHLVDWSQRVPLLVIGTARPELLERRPGWGTGKPAGKVLALAPLSEDEAATLVTGLVEDAVLPEQLSEAIVLGAGGNPLYAGEYVRMLADRGLLGVGGGAPDPAEDLPMPESLHSIIAARLDGLPADEKAVAHDAAVVGKVFWTGAVATIGARSRRSTERLLRALERKEFLKRTRRSSVAGEGEYTFGHVLMSDVAYSQMPRRRRAEAHRRAAEWLESLGVERVLDRAEMLAHHYLRALELANAVGEDASDLTHRARIALRDAGDKALTLHAFSAARRFYRQALGLWPEDDSERPRLLLHAGKALYYVEIAGEEILTEARDGLLRVGDPAAAAEAESLLGMLQHHRGHGGSMLEHIEHATMLVGDLESSRSKAEVLVDLAGGLMVSNHGRRAIGIGREALAIADELGLQELQAHALGIIGTARWSTGDLEGEIDLTRSIAIAEEIGSPRSVFGYASLADLMGTLGQLDRCFALQAKSREQAERFGHAGFVRWLKVERVGEGYWRGGWAEAVALAEEFLAEAEAGSPHFMESYCRVMRGRVLLARGDEKRALEDAGRALEFARQAGDLQMLYPALAFRARALLRAGLRDAAAELADELLELWEANRDGLPPSSWVADLASALWPLGRGLELKTIAARVMTRTLWLDAAEAYVQGDFQAAAHHYSAIGSLPDEAFARLTAAHRLSAVGDESAAQGEARRALAFYRRVDALAYLSETEAQIASSIQL